MMNSVNSNIILLLLAGGGGGVSYAYCDSIAYQQYKDNHFYSQEELAKHTGMFPYQQ